MKEQRIRQLFEILTEDTHVYTAKYLASQLFVSAKTITNDIKKLNRILEGKGACITPKAGQGYTFQIQDKLKFSEFLKSEWYTQSFDNDFSTQYARANCMILSLVSSASYIKSEHFLTEFYISRAQLNLDLKYMRQILSEFHLTLETKPYYGMVLRGSENDIRNWLVHYIEDSHAFDPYTLASKITKIPMDTIQALKECVLRVFRAHSYRLPLVKYNNFVVHLLVSLWRTRNNNLVDTNDISKNSCDKKMYALIDELAQEICGVSFEVPAKVNVKTPYPTGAQALISQPSELIHLAYVLQGLQSIEPASSNEKLEEMLEVVFQDIKEATSIDLAWDIDLKNALIQHLSLMIERIQAHAKLKCPLLEDINTDRLAVECANICTSHIAATYDIAVDEDEAGYVTLHFAASLIRQREKLLKKKILLVSGMGQATTRILSTRLQQEFSPFIGLLEWTDPLALADKDIHSYDLVITTAPLATHNSIHPQDWGVPIVEVSPQLFKNDVHKLKEYLNSTYFLYDIQNLFDPELFFYADVHKIEPSVKHVDYKRVLAYMAHAIAEAKNVDEQQLYDALLAREELASTGYTNMVAIPHPLKPISEQNFVSVLVSPSNIYWQGDKVHVVILIVMNNIDNSVQVESFYKLLSSYLTDSDAILSSMDAKDLYSFLKVFVNHQK